jgi:phosphatidylglycerol lysyltransferase
VSGIVSQAEAVSPSAIVSGEAVAGPHASALRRLGRWLPHVVGLVLFALAIWVIHKEIAAFGPGELFDRLDGIPASAIGLAVLATAVGYGTLTRFDPLALAYLGKRLPYRRTALASFTGYAFSHNLGFGWLSGGAVRYRLYTAWGLSSLDIGAIIAVNTVTTTLGLSSILALACLGEPDAIAGIVGLPAPIVVAIGLALAAAIAGYLLACALRRAPVGIGRWQFALPPPPMGAAQIVLSMLDWSLAAAVLYILLPPVVPLGYLAFVGLFGLANLVGLISNVPGGIGVFEAVILLAIPDGSASAAAAAALIAYRVIYYLVPLAIAALLLGGQQLLSTGRRAGAFALAVAPNVFALVVFAAGVMMLASGAAPTIAGRMQALAAVVPLGVIEISHFLASVAGVLLLLVAWELRRRLDGAYVAALLILAAGIVLSLLRGLHVEQAAVLALTFLALAPCRRAFYRRAALFAERFSPGWLLAVAAVLLGVLWLAFFAHRHVEYSNDLWWHFVLAEDASRSLRATAGAVIVLLLIGAAQLLRVGSRPAPDLQPGDLARARAVIAATPDAPVAANLALLGDKRFLFSDSGRSLIMFGAHGGTWIALGEPVGPADERQEILWRFRELCDRYGTRPAFYNVTPESMPQLVELGLTFQKLGEEALVPLDTLSIEGLKSRNLRYKLRRLRREGCRFEIVPVAEVPGILDALAAISDEWLKSKNLREMGFSLGRFDRAYMLNFPVAVVRVGDRIVAFANVWMSGDRRELSIDLMRHAADVPHGIMEYLFFELMLWGKEQGYGRFSLGVVPLAGLERRRLAPLWSQAGAFLFRHGEHFYNFQGLLRFKAQFGPLWEPRYLAAPGGFALPRVLGDVTLLISGGVGGLVTG